ncbi:MAG: auxin-binding protein [Lysobacteraceae bacterium]|nr:MAG: auxin-binding protein [Xanthomonadaceae bacterium]
MNSAKSITNINDTAFTERGNGGSFAYAYSRLGPEIGLQKLGCGQFVVPPGKSAFPYHAHSELEELCLILSGRGTLRQRGEQREIKEGDLICSSVGVAHQITNTSDEDLSYLVISSQATSDIVHYPDSDKYLAYSSAFDPPLVHISKSDSRVDYYDGEE